MSWTRLMLAATIVCQISAQNSYILTLPSEIRPGLDLKVLVNIFNATQDVTVNVELWKGGQPNVPIGPFPVLRPAVAPVDPPPPERDQPQPPKEPLPSPSEEKILERRATVQAGRPVTISLQLPSTLTEGNYFLRVTGNGGLTFENRGTLLFNRNSLAVFIQTDKGIYRPSQTVLFRVFAVSPDLKPYTGTFDVNIFDPKNNKIKQYTDVRGDDGIYSGELTLSDQPVTGRWKIEATANGETETVYVTVEQFVLPKFEVIVSVPEYGHIQDTELSGTVEAKYTFGEVVEGTALVRVRNNFFFIPRGVPCTEPVIEKRFPVNGRTSFTISVNELQFLGLGCDGEPLIKNPSQFQLDFLRGKVIKVEAEVTETLTGTTLSGVDQIQYSEKRYRLQWLSSNSKNFKPGLWYDSFLKVTNNDGSPIPVTEPPQKVTLDIVASFDDGCRPLDIRPAGSTPPAVKAPTRISLVEADLPVNGLIRWSNRVPADAVSVTFTASFPDAFNETQNIEKMDSPSNSFIQLFLPQPSITIVARGSVVQTVELDGQNRRGFFEEFTASNQMAPSSKLVAYAVLPSGEIVADSISFNVDDIYENQVSLRFCLNTCKPGQEVSVTVTSDPNSVVNLMAVDQSILLLNKGNDITPNRVERKISVFGGGYRPLPSAFGRFQFQLPFNGGDATSIFRNAGILVISDGPAPHEKELQRQFVPLATAFAPAESSGPVEDELLDPERVRTFFPDTWLWASKTSGPNRRAVFSAAIPDTITSWVVSAFALNSASGLGVAPTNPKVEAFLPFFVTLNLPKSVIRGEEVVLQAIVFNFLQVDTAVTVTLSGSNDFLNIGLDNNGQTTTSSVDKVERIQVLAGKARSVFFPIRATTLGNIDLQVRAQSSVAADALIRQLRVEPEGVAQDYNRPLLIDLTQSGARFEQTLPLPLPDNVVPGSVRVKTNVLGDLLGPTINNLDKLLKMPSGCGEQNMINFAPDVFILKYLTETGQLTNEIRDKATQFLEKGYQRQLTYQRTDGSFSAFGNTDEAGSTWLTAFVVKSFSEAKPFTFIDDKVLNRAVDWLVNNQDPSGAFRETGNVIHTEMQGGAARGTPLTAYALIAIYEQEALSTENAVARRNAINRARSYLEAEVSSVSDVYALSIVSYALKLVNSQEANRAFTRLQALATVRDGEKFWDVPSRDERSGSGPVPLLPDAEFWTPPIIIRSQNVEATSYALLTIAERRKTTDGLPVIKWLAQQRNPTGGYASTQDTVVALQALSEFAGLIYSPTSNVDVVVSAANFRQSFGVSRSSALILQSTEIPGPPDSVTISASGSGTAIVEVSVSYNVFRDNQEPAFDIRVTLRNETINGFVLETCATYTRNSTSGMVVQETGIPTGFQPDIESIGKVRGLKRTELLDRKVALYFDQVTSNPRCVRMRVNRVGLVAKTQAVPVRIFQYYSPDEQVTVFYQSQLLNNSNFCDICSDCSCPGR
ncbi:CD109 antigen-like [Liolophura sinensis]|uniref:CD109 antigen-like n=1 Tax=Liolophura sinensis TaxID=3198878 RepID=UPI00315850B8